jgi:hypothetical protein
LRRRLIDANRHAEAYTPPEEIAALPKSFGDLLDQIEELKPFVFFTGDRNACQDLDQHPQNSVWAQAAWPSLLALRDYARAKGTGIFAGDFKQWCEAPAGNGRVIPPGKVARDESSSVRANKRFALARTLPVPVEVDPSGRMFMGAHLKLGTTATVSPRMHFYEAVADGRTVIYVGYLGRHLPNSLTS